MYVDYPHVQKERKLEIEQTLSFSCMEILFRIFINSVSKDLKSSGRRRGQRRGRRRRRKKKKTLQWANSWTNFV
jgi:predicted transposase YdaD